MIKLIKEIKASENGHKVDTYPPGEYETLPPNALAHAENIGAIERSKTQPKNKAVKPSKTK